MGLEFLQANFDQTQRRSPLSRTSGNGGLIPHARHGAKGKDSVALAESKFGGTELENEQIGQTQVPVDFGTSDCTDGDLKRTARSCYG